MGTGKGGADSGVTVIVLTYGSFEVLERTLRSVEEQTFPIDALIVSDDGSGEELPPALQKHFPKVQFRMNENNVGTVAHMNAAVRETQSEYIKFLAGGDMFSDPQALETLVKFAKGENALAVTSQAMVCTEELDHRLYLFPGGRAEKLKGPGVVQFHTLAISNLISAPGTLFHSSFFARLGGFDESYRLLEDWPTWLRLTREGYAIPFLDQLTCLHAVGGISSKNLDAYHAPRLKEDMLLCYEKEILPYIGEFSSKEARKIRYGYDMARGVSHEELIKKYGWLEQKTTWKRSVKRWLLRL